MLLQTQGSKPRPPPAWRLGQTRPTRLVRVLARVTIDEPVAALAAERRSAGAGDGVVATAFAADEDEGTVVRLLDAHP